MKPEGFEISAFEKLANSKLVRKIYPMIDEITVTLFEPTGSFYLLIKIYLNTSDISEENMYKKGFDPHFLVDFHLSKLFRYLGLNWKTTPVKFIVYDSEGYEITSG